MSQSTATHLDPFDPIDAAPALPTTQEPDDAEVQLIGELNDILADCKRERKELDVDVSFNRAFISGSQLVGLDEVSQEFLRVVTMRSPDRFPSIDNKLLGIYRAWIGKMIKSLGQVNVRPRNGTYLETRAAEGMSTYLEYKFDDQRLLKKMKKAFGSAAYAPAGYIVASWDRDGGEQVGYCEKCKYVSEAKEIGKECPSCLKQAIMQLDQGITVEKQAAAIGMPPEPQLMQMPEIPKLIATSQGDLRLNFYRWSEIHIDNAALEPEDMRYFIIEKPMPVGVIRAKYPKLRDVIHEEKITHDRYLQRYETGLQYRERRYQNHAMYREFHFLPSTMFPAGQIIATACDRVLDVKPNIYAKLIGRLSLFMFRADVFDDSIYGLPWATHVISLQRERNKLLSQVRAQRELTLYPVLVGEDNCGINKRTELAKPGERILLKRGTTIQPYYLRTPPLPNYVVEEADRLSTAMQEKAGVTQSEMGQPGAADESGRLAAFNDSQSNDTIRSITIENNCEWLALNDAILQIGYYFGDAGKEWTVKRGGKLVSMSWATIGVAPSKGSIYLVEKDILSSNPVLRLTMAERLLKAGYFNDNETGLPNMEKFGQFAGIIELSGYDTEQADRRYATQIPQMLREGAIVQPMPWDRVKVIADELTDWLRSEGRYGDQEETMQVAQIWMQYAMAFIQHAQMTGTPMSPDAVNIMPVQGAMGGMASMTNPTSGLTAPGAGAAPGGGPSGPVPPTVSQSIKNADQTAETKARQTSKQEGSSI